jgi:hypothetical protein
MLTTGLDNLLGTNGNDVVLAELGGDDDTLELDDAFNALLGQDTLRLDILGDATFDSADYHMVGFERVLVQARADDVDLTIDLADMAGVDLEVRNMVGGADGDLTADNIDGDVLVVNFDGDDIALTNVGGDVVWNGVSADYIDIDSVAGTVTLTDVEVSGELNIGDGVDGEITGDAVSLTNVELSVGVDVNIVFASSVTDATVNLAGFSQAGYDFDLDDSNSNSYFDIEGAELTNLVINVNADSDMNELHFHGNPELTSITFNMQADLIIDEFQGPSDGEDEVASTLTINGAGNLIINSIEDDDFLDIVYTGSGSLQIGAEDRALGDEDDASDWEMNVGSFNASTATGDVTLFLDLDDHLNDEEDSLDFTYVGSQGDDRVVIADAESLNNAATDEDLIALSIEGGTGTDTLVVLGSDDLSTAALSKVSGFETVELTGFGESETFNLANAGEFTNVVLSHAVDANYNEDITVSGLSAVQAENITIVQEGATVDYDDGVYDVSEDNVGDLFNDLTLSLASATGTSDVVSITFVQDTNQLTDGETVQGTLTVDAVETINLTSIGGSYTGFAAEYTEGDSYTFTEVADLDADALRTLNISGTGSLGIQNIDAEELTVIDARGFTGPFLGLGDDNFERAVNTELDLVVHGSATADHDININGNETVTITTGSGDDNINVNANDQITVNAGAGDNEIYLDSGYEGATVTTGDGDDFIAVQAADDIVITAGAGFNLIFADSEDGDATITTLGGDDVIFVSEAEDVIVNAGNGDNLVVIGSDFDGSGEEFLQSNAISDDVTVTTGTGEDEIIVLDGEDVTVTSGADEDAIYIDHDVSGRVIVDAGSQNDVVEIDVDTAAESFRITLGAGVDTLVVNSSADDGEITNEFFVTDFAAGTGGDIVALEHTNGTTNAHKKYFVETSADGEYTFATSATNETSILEFSFDAVNAPSTLAATYGSSSDITGAQLLTALGNGGASADITVADETDGYIIAYSGGDAFLFHFDTDIDGAGGFTPTAAGDSITFSAGNGDEWEAGDVITISGLVVSGDDEDDVGTATGSFTYTVEANDTITDIANAIANGITNYTNSSFDATFAGGVVTITDGSANFDAGDHIRVSVVEAINTTVLEASDITLVGVMDNVAVGSLATGNFSVFSGNFGAFDFMVE